MSKSKRGKSASTNEISKWEAEFAQTLFNEESWRSCVFFIAPKKQEDNAYLDVVADVVSTGLRKMFSVVTEEGLMKDVRDFGKAQTGGKGKGAPTSKAPAFSEVCEQAKAVLDQGETILPSMMAKLVKFKLLQIKQKDLDRREEERKASKAAEAGKKDEKGKKSRSPSGKSRSKSPGKKKGKKDVDVPPSPKKDTKMKKRGDVEDTFKTIDDEPDDEGSPQHYVLIHGIWRASVINHMAELGINVDAIICMKSETYDKFEVKKQEVETTEEQQAAEEQDPEALDKAMKEEEEKANQLEKEKQLQTFWTESDNIVLKAQSGNKLKDIAKYEVIVKDKDVPEASLQELEDEKKVEFGTILFEDVAVTCYNMLDHFVLYKQYLESMKLVHVPVHTLAGAEPAPVAPSVVDLLSSQSATGVPAPEIQAPIPVEVDTRYYKHLIDTVPTESHSVPLILHCLLEQVTATVDENNPLDKELPLRDDGLNHLLAAHIDSKAGKLALTEDEKKAIFSGSAEEKTNTANSNVPILLYNGDTLMAQAHHLLPQNGLDPLQVQLQMFQLFPSNALKDLPEPKGRETAEQAACANELRHFLKSKSVDPAVLDHVLKQYAFEGMLLKTVTDDGYIIDPVDLDEAFRSYSNPWDYPYSKLEDFMKVKFCSDESGRLKIAEVDSNSPLTSFRNLDDWCFVEHFDQTTLLQLLEETRYSLPYVDTYYHKRDHSLLLVLHNPMGLEAKSQTSWQTKLHSNVGFRNYLDYVTSFIQSWVDEQERLRMEAARTPTPPPIVVEEPPPPLKEGSRYGLMTRSEVNALKAEEEEKNKKGKGKKSGRASRSPGRRSAKSRGGKDESPEKKDKKREGSSTSRPKSGRTSSAKGSLSVKSSSSKHDKKGARSKSRTSCQDDTEEDTFSQPIEVPIEEHFDFIGYDVGDKLIQVSGSLMTLFPADGGQIRVDKNSYVQGTKNVRVSMLKDGNLFMLHFVDPVDEIMLQENTEPEENKNKKDNDQECKDKQEEDEGIEKSEIEGNEKERKELINKIPKGPKPFCNFSSFVAQFNDGMILTHSGYGPSGSIIGKETKEMQLISSIVVPEAGGATHGTPSPQPKAGSPKSRKKMDEEVKRMEELQQQQEEERARAEEEARKREEEEKRRKPFQNLFITCPDGLHLEYFNNGAYHSALDKGGVAVRQRYPVKGLGKQECEKTRQKPAMEEVSRTILTDGTVIRFMKDDFIQVLFPDGGISSCQSYPMSSKPTSQPASAVVAKQPEASPAKKGLRATSSQKSSEEPQVPTVNVPEKVAQWVSTGIGGARVRTKEDGEVESLDGVLYSLATCPETGQAIRNASSGYKIEVRYLNPQVLRTRKDNVVTVERSDGTLVVDHADGTRITSFYQELQTQTQVPDNETGEEAQYQTINGKFVRVECPGFASLTFNCHEGSCGTVFGNGVYMETLADGVTTVERVDDSQLHIDAKGVVSFAPRELTDKIDLSSPAPTQQPIADIPAGVYVMRSTQQNCCEMKDLRGTHFRVISNGEMSIDKQELQKEKEHQGVLTKEESASIAQSFPQTSLVPRYFMIHSDGSGSELLRHVDVSGFLSRAEKDPTTAVLSSPVEGHPEATGVTILKPYAGGISKEWLLTKIEDVIIPAAIRERDFTAFPSHHEKRPGPVFGTNVGVGLNVGAVIKNKPSSPPITCPPAFEFRQLIQYKRLTDEQRQQIVTCLKEYSKYVAKRKEKLDSILPQDPRDESEKLVAANLELKMREAEKKVKEETVTKDDDINSEEEEPEPVEEQAEIKDGIKEVIDSMTGQVQGDSVRQKYVDAITPAPVPRPPPPRWKRSRSEWERDKIELAELEYGKNALKNHQVPPYFETAQGQEFLQRAYNNIPDMDTLTSRLAEQTRHPPPGDGSVSETPRSESGGEELKLKSQQELSSPEVAQVTSTSANNEDDSSPSANDNALSPNNLRPTNPTPAHATGGGTPTPLRPNNPTPAHASKPSNPRPSNPTPKHAEGLREELEPSNEASPVFEEQQQWRSNLESVREIESNQNEQANGIVTQSNNSSNNSEMLTDTPGNPKVGAKSLYTDVTGGLRKDKVKLPTSILSAKPGALLNSQFLDIEDPVRRRVHTVSVAGGNKISPGRVEGLRGFELFPPKVSFGVLKEGCTYMHTVIMKNVGIDSCRFKIKQPPLSTGLRVLYNPGPVAAGMNAKLDIEIFAVAVGVVGESGVGQVGHHVEIVTETDVIYLPVYATIMTAYEYENRYGDQDSGLTCGTSRVPNRPPSRDPTRPRKSIEYALINQESI